MNLFENHYNWTHHGILIPGLTSHQLERQVIHNDAVFWIFVKINHRGVFKLQYVQVPFWKWPKERAYFQSPATLRIIPVIFVYTCSHTVRKPLERPSFAVSCTKLSYELCGRLVWKPKIPNICLQDSICSTQTLGWPLRTHRSIEWNLKKVENINDYIAQHYGTVCQLIYHSNL